MSGEDMFARAAVPTATRAELEQRLGSSLEQREIIVILYKVKRLTAAVLPCGMLTLGALIVLVSGVGLLKLLKLGMLPAKTKGGTMNIASTLGSLVIGFVSSLLAGIALLP